MLSGVSVSCFLFSYMVVLLMEASRFFLKLPARSFLLIAMLSAGVVAHTIFLGNEIASSETLLGNWFQWTVLSAWGLSVACLFVTVRNPERSMGLFIVPVILGLIALAQLLRPLDPFPTQTTESVWKNIHGVSLLVGTMFISLGFAFSLMYLVQSYRLKSKGRRRSVLKLPTLEFLQSMNRMSLFLTTACLGIGLLSGIVLNINRDAAIWFSGGVLLTFVLFAIALVATLAELSSVGSLGGRKSAYLSIASVFLLALVLLFVFLSSHGQPDEASTLPNNQQPELNVYSRPTSNVLVGEANG